MNITVAVDGSSYSKYALQTLAHLAPPQEIVVTHALHLPDFNYAMITPELRAEVQTDMEAKLKKEGEGIPEPGSTTDPFRLSTTPNHSSNWTPCKSDP